MAYESEQEQIEAIRQWWQENGRSVIAGVAIALIAVFGWQGWQSYQQSQALAASKRFEEIAAAIDADELAVARERLQTLSAEHPGNASYPLATLRLAAAYTAADDLDNAVAVLRPMVESAEQPALVPLARLRLGQALLGADRRDAALQAIEPITDGPYLARAAELRGDLHAAAGDREAAVQAYRAAMQANPMAQRRQLITSKLADLGADTDQAST